MGAIDRSSNRLLSILDEKPPCGTGRICLQQQTMTMVAIHATATVSLTVRSNSSGNTRVVRVITFVPTYAFAPMSRLSSSLSIAERTISSNLMGLNFFCIRWSGDHAIIASRYRARLGGYREGADQLRRTVSENAYLQRSTWR